VVAFWRRRLSRSAGGQRCLVQLSADPLGGRSGALTQLDPIVRPVPIEQALRTPAELKLYSPGQVAGAAFLGSPIAGFWLVAGNYRALERTGAARQSLAWGVLATIGVFAIALALPPSWPDHLLPLAYTEATRQAAKRLQGAAFQAHVDAGGAKQSSWRVLALGVEFLVAVLALAFAPSCCFPSEK